MPRDLELHEERALFAHYEELRRWNPTLNLIGPGTVDGILDRHFGESFAALPWVQRLEGEALDLGSGAGFPALPLAALVPGLRFTLVESRQRKCAFLRLAARRGALPLECLDVRVSLPLPAALPERLVLVTARALKLPPELLSALGSRLTMEGRILLWVGREEPPLPSDLAIRGELPLEGSEHRRILDVRRSG